MGWLKAETFAERWRVAMIVLVAGAGMISTALAAWIVTIIARSGWSAAVEALRVEALSHALLAMIGLMTASMIGLLVAGPLSRISANVAGNSVEVEGDPNGE